jgi:hypothetical protein
LTTGVHALIVGDHLVRRRDWPSSRPPVLDLVPSLAPSRKLVRRSTGRGGDVAFFIESTASDLFCDPMVPISREVFKALVHESESTVRRRLIALQIRDASIYTRLGDELFDLWQSRAIRLLPDD